MPRTNQESRQSVGVSGPGKNRRRQEAVARNLAFGMKPEEALFQAGYSKTTARKRAYQVVQHPVIQSILTESCERVLEKHNKIIDDLLIPFVEALKAPLIVKSGRSGKVLIPLDPETGQPFPDHRVRMKAGEHLMGLYCQPRAQAKKRDDGTRKSPVNFQIDFVESPPISGSKQNR